VSWSHPVEEGEPLLHARPNVGGHHDEVHLSFTDGLAADHKAAVNLWHAANLARGLPPSADRVGRIWEKLAEPQACLVIGHLDSSKGVLAMALAEPGRADHGAGAVTATSPWSSSTPTCGDATSAGTCWTDSTSAGRNGDGTA
jgi:hypothetical protein